MGGRRVDAPGPGRRRASVGRPRSAEGVPESRWAARGQRRTSMTGACSTGDLPTPYCSSCFASLAATGPSPPIAAQKAADSSPCRSSDTWQVEGARAGGVRGAPAPLPSYLQNGASSCATRLTGLPHPSPLAPSAPTHPPRRPARSRAISGRAAVSGDLALSRAICLGRGVLEALQQTRPLPGGRLRSAQRGEGVTPASDRPLQPRPSWLDARGARA